MRDTLACSECNDIFAEQRLKLGTHPCELLELQKEEGKGDNFSQPVRISPRLSFGSRQRKRERESHKTSDAVKYESKCERAEQMEEKRSKDVVVGSPFSPQSDSFV